MTTILSYFQAANKSELFTFEYSTKYTYQLTHVLNYSVEYLSKKNQKFTILDFAGSMSKNYLTSTYVNKDVQEIFFAQFEDSEKFGLTKFENIQKKLVESDSTLIILRSLEVLEMTCNQKEIIEFLLKLKELNFSVQVQVDTDLVQKKIQQQVELLRDNVFAATQKRCNGYSFTAKYELNKSNFTFSKYVAPTQEAPKVELDELTTFNLGQTDKEKHIKLQLEKEIKPYLQERENNNPIFNYEAVDEEQDEDDDLDV